MLASPEDAIADMLRTHASDDAAFVFEELMENPMEIGKEVAAFLRRRKAKKQVSPLSVNIRTFFATCLSGIMYIHGLTGFERFGV